MDTLVGSILFSIWALSFPPSTGGPSFAFFAKGGIDGRHPSTSNGKAVCVAERKSYWFAVIFWMVLVVLTPITVGTISTRPPQVVTSSAPTMVAAV
jgi:hypothetical protein